MRSFLLFSALLFAVFLPLAAAQEFKEVQFEVFLDGSAEILVGYNNFPCIKESVFELKAFKGSELQPLVISRTLLYNGQPEPVNAEIAGSSFTYRVSTVSAGKGFNLFRTTTSFINESLDSLASKYFLPAGLTSISFASSCESEPSAFLKAVYPSGSFPQRSRIDFTFSDITTSDLVSQSFLDSSLAPAFSQETHFSLPVTVNVSNPDPSSLKTDLFGKSAPVFRGDPPRQTALFLPHSLALLRSTTQGSQQSGKSYFWVSPRNLAVDVGTDYFQLFKPDNLPSMVGLFLLALLVVLVFAVAFSKYREVELKEKEEQEKLEKEKQEEEKRRRERSEALGPEPSQYAPPENLPPLDELEPQEEELPSDKDEFKEFK